MQFLTRKAVLGQHTFKAASRERFGAHGWSRCLHRGQYLLAKTRSSLSRVGRRAISRFEAVANRQHRLLTVGIVKVLNYFGKENAIVGSSLKFSYSPSKVRKLNEDPNCGCSISELGSMHPTS